jgi:hypothetical protein
MNPQTKKREVMIPKAMLLESLEEFPSAERGEWDREEGVSEAMDVRWGEGRELV